MICPSYYENKMLSCLLDIVLFKKKSFLVLFFEVVHSMRGPASRVIRLNHAEIPVEVGRYNNVSCLKNLKTNHNVLEDKEGE